MPASEDFDWQKVYFVLRDVERTTRSRPARIALTLDPQDAPAVVRGVADREGLIALGLNLAVSALEAGTSLAVRPDGTIARDGGSGLIEFTVADSASVTRMHAPPRPWKPLLRLIVGAFALVGAYTVWGWVAGTFSR